MTEVGFAMTQQTSMSEDKEVSYKLLVHGNINYIGVSFAYNKEFNKRMQNVRGAKWSTTHKCWLIPDTEANRIKCELPSKIITAFPDVALHLKRVQDKLSLKAYSANTSRNYCGHLKEFFLEIKKRHTIETVTKEIIERYLLNRLGQKHSSESDMNSHINAIKFYYEQVLNRERMLFDLPRPKKPLQLPKVLGERELERLFTVMSNIKHKAILLTAFSCGLRISETINLKLTDIDSERMQVFVERSKNKKDRYVTLSPLLLDVLRSYLLQHKPRPVKYLFEGYKQGEPYSSRSGQMLFKTALDKARINKNISFHSLRHSYATHLLEKGVDIKYIKDLLGHFDIRTTERYLHVSRDKLIHIASPLDYLFNDDEKRLNAGLAKL